MILSKLSSNQLQATRRVLALRKGGQDSDMSKRMLLIAGLFTCVVLIASVCWSAAVQTPIGPSLDNKDPGKVETAIGSLVADSFRAAMHTDVAFVSAGDLRVGTAPAKPQPEDITALLAYPDELLVVLALDGRMIRTALETSIASCPRPGLSFLQVSGLRFVYDAAKPAGSRIVSISVGPGPMVDSQAYTVAVPNSLAGGALGYWKVWSKRNIVSKAAPVTIAAAVEKFVKANPKLDYALLNRITVAK